MADDNNALKVRVPAEGTNEPMQVLMHFAVMTHPLIHKPSRPGAEGGEAALQRHEALVGLLAMYLGKLDREAAELVTYKTAMYIQTLPLVMDELGERIAQSGQFSAEDAEELAREHPTLVEFANAAEMSLLEAIARIRAKYNADLAIAEAQTAMRDNEK